MGSRDRTALIVHPGLDRWSGGEYVTLEIAKALLDKEYDVTIASEGIDIEGGERIWDGGNVLKRCGWIELPKPRWDRMKSLQRLFDFDQLIGLKPDIVFEAQKSTYVMPDRRTVSMVYHPGDLLYYWGNGWRSKRELYYRFIRLARGTLS